MSGVIPWVADAVILGALLVLSIAVYGVFRMPDIYTRLHAASKTAVLGIVPLLVAVMLTGNVAFIARSVLIGAFLLLTTPVAAHAIAHAAFDVDRSDVVEPLAMTPARTPDDGDDSRMNH